MRTSLRVLPFVLPRAGAVAVGLAGAAVLVLSFGACGGGVAKPTDDEAIPECEAYVAKYRGCIDQGGGAARVTAMREGFRSAAKDDRGRAHVRERCVAGVRQLEEACR